MALAGALFSSLEKSMRSPPKTKLKPLEFQVFDAFTHWREQPVLWLALSGGFDSWVLLNVLAAVAPRWGIRLSVIHVHHGFVDNSEQMQFRDRAEQRVREWAHAFKLELTVIRGQPESQSEAALREVRRQAFRGLDGPVVTAHHFDDVFETRLIRLLRGTGGRGLAAMEADGDAILRPLLSVTRDEMMAYAALLSPRAGLPEPAWLDDPSNHDRRYLRTRVRLELIPLLNEIRKGGANAMARSLEIIASDVENSVRRPGDARPSGRHDPRQVVVQPLLRAELMALSPAERRRQLGAFLRQHAVLNYTSGQIDEVLKRLDSPRKRLTFEVIPGQRWEVGIEIRLVPID